jgi:hypothetical protein
MSTNSPASQPTRIFEGISTMIGVPPSMRSQAHTTQRQCALSYFGHLAGIIAAVTCLAVVTCFTAVAFADDAVPARRVEVHLFGGDVSKGAPLTTWYRSIGITDAWLYPVKGAFPQDQRPESQQTIAELESAGTLDAYRKNHIRYWWFERPVPDFFYHTAKRSDAPKSHLWDSSRESDAQWAEVCAKIAAIYPEARKAGFTGVAYDTESYYSYQGDEQGKTKPWVWGGHDDQFGLDGNYYKRGLQVGRAIHDAWPDAKVVLAYAFGYEGEVWWYRGIKDGGVDFYIGPEHTYGAGPPEFGGNDSVHAWWQGKKTKEGCDLKRAQFPFIADNQHVMAGVFPIDFNAKKPNYRAKYFREQLQSAAEADVKGPIAVWIWPQGPFTPQSWLDIKYASGESADDYLHVLRDYSQAFSAKDVK